ncbi:sulfotransferase 1A1-like isoform X1 [Leptidea sinapis]|uniref:sulfotransferase 1A1-like isoform X1 n=2 Tax=Leptidea sinapis TaxID=189913 RepID=UPI00214703A3|nr:sulfotransferase 1A1-like isoform X1 [Leptidea sinapis]
MPDKVYPYEIRDVDPDTAKTLMTYFKGELTGFVRVGPKGYFFPHKFKEEAESYYNMEIRPTDIFVTSYPRSGTTWTQELVWMVANDLDYATSDAIPLTERYPFLEFSMCVHPRMKEIFTEENKDDERKLKLLEWVTQPGTEQLAAATSRRFVKTHIPLSLLPPNLLDAKVVYVARDPRDVVVSFYHLNKSMRTQGYVGDFKQFWEFFSHDLHHWTPYFEHLKEAWEMRHHPNLLFLFYEELSKDLPKAVRRVADFLGKDFNDEQIAHLCEHLSIDSFKNNKSVNYDVMKELGIMIGNRGFIRKGKAGGWRDYFNDEMTFQAERWLADNLKDTDLRFPHLQF